jgi:class 3 adenylate cyclase
MPSLLLGIVRNKLELIAFLLSITVLALSIAAVHLRWFSHFRRCFLLTLMAAVVGTGLTSSLFVGIWSFESAKQVMIKEFKEEMEWLERFVESGISDGIQKSLTRMSELSSVIFRPAMERGDLDETREKIANLLRLNRSLVQVDLHDKSGRLLATANSGNSTEPVNRVAATYALEGLSFSSDPYLSTVFDKHVLYLSVPVQSPEGEFLGSLSYRVDLEEMFRSLLVSTRFGESGHLMLVSHDGLILVHPDRARTKEDISTYRAVQLGLKGDSGSLVDFNRDGQKRLFFYRPVKGLGTINPKPMVLMAEMDVTEISSIVRNLRLKLFLGMGMIVLACLAIAQQLSRYIKRPLGDLLHMVARVQAGDLSARAQIRGHDEIEQLGAALNGMAEGLQERDMVKEIFGRYVATQVSEQVLKGKVNLGGECRRVTMLFSDIRNFTAMAEQMEPTQVVDFLNDYFSEMVEAVFEYGGILDKFMGDGMLAVFGSFGDGPDHPRRAVMAALRMKALLAKINGRRSMIGKPPFNIGVGIHTDEVVTGNIGSLRRLEYTVVGDGVNTTSRVESLNKLFNTTILITASTYEEVKDLFECRLMPEAQAKGKTQTLQVYEVLSVRS